MQFKMRYKKCIYICTQNSTLTWTSESMLEYGKLIVVLLMESSLTIVLCVTRSCCIKVTLTGWTLMVHSPFTPFLFKSWCVQKSWFFTLTLATDIFLFFIVFLPFYSFYLNPDNLLSHYPPKVALHSHKKETSVIIFTSKKALPIK
jgi:hypothetical protein